MGIILFGLIVAFLLMAQPVAAGLALLALVVWLVFG